MNISLFRSSFLLLVLFLPTIFLGQSLEVQYDKNMMDFWVGEWEVSWKGNDSVSFKGNNVVRKILDEKVIEENFSITSGPNKGYNGKSWSVFNPRTQNWKQTWVDDQGAYLDFTGEISGDSIIFEREFQFDSLTVRHQRMVFFNIGEDQFQWIWQHRDIKQGQKSANWLDDWMIQYKRKE